MRSPLCELANLTFRPTSTSWSSFIHSSASWRTIQTGEWLRQHQLQALRRPTTPAATPHHLPPHQHHRFVTIDRDTCRAMLSTPAHATSTSASACSKTTYSDLGRGSRLTLASNSTVGHPPITRPNEVRATVTSTSFNGFCTKFKSRVASSPQRRNIFVYRGHHSTSVSHLCTITKLPTWTYFLEFLEVKIFPFLSWKKMWCVWENILWSTKTWIGKIVDRKGVEIILQVSASWAVSRVLIVNLKG